MEEPLPLRNKDKALSSAEVNRSKLASVEDILKRYRHLIKSGASAKNISMLCVKLAKKAIFGEEVIRCTPGGTHDMPRLPAKKLYDLLMQYPQYWQCLHEFEGVWKRCRDCIEQACKCEMKRAFA